MNNPKNKAKLVEEIKSAIDQVVVTPLAPHAKAAAYAGSVKLYVQMSRLLQREYEAVLDGLLEEVKSAKKATTPLSEKIGKKKIKLELSALYQ